MLRRSGIGSRIEPITGWCFLFSSSAKYCERGSGNDPEAAIIYPRTCPGVAAIHTISRFGAVAAERQAERIRHHLERSAGRCRPARCRSAGRILDTGPVSTSPEIRSLVLDVDGVLMDERRTYARFRRHALERLPEASAHSVLAALRVSIRDRAPGASRAALVSLGGRPDLASEIWRLIGNVDRPYSEAQMALERLSRRYRLAVLGNQAAACRGRLVEAGLLRYFDEIVLSDEVQLAKPDRSIFELVLGRLGVEPRAAAMVGDRLDLDIGPARRLGMTGIRMLRGPHVWQKPVDVFEHPDLTVRSLSELAERLSSAA